PPRSLCILTIIPKNIDNAGIFSLSSLIYTCELYFIIPYIHLAWHEPKLEKVKKIKKQPPGDVGKLLF
ncbi:hypothetical protein, partial [Anaerovibrio slackiae]|uniref:hypothetical protein n=1 Tax=Anaerovibrio slackiae TaxID=2652309 RepID=UPI003864CFAA